MKKQDIAVKNNEVGMNDKNLDLELEFVIDLSKKLYEQEQQKNDLIKFEAVNTTSAEQQRKVDEIKRLMSQQQPTTSNQMVAAGPSRFPTTMNDSNNESIINGHSINSMPAQKHHSLTNLNSFDMLSRPSLLQKQNSFDFSPLYPALTTKPPPIYPRLNSLTSASIPPPPRPPKPSQLQSNPASIQIVKKSGDLLSLADPKFEGSFLNKELLSMEVKRPEPLNFNSQLDQSESVHMKLYQQPPGPAPFNSDIYVPFATILEDLEELKETNDKNVIIQPTTAPEVIEMSPDFNTFFNFNMEKIQTTSFDKVKATFYKRDSLNDKLFRGTDGLTDEQCYIQGWFSDSQTNSFYGIQSPTTKYALTKVSSIKIVVKTDYTMSTTREIATVCSISMTVEELIIQILAEIEPSADIDSTKFQLKVPNRLEFMPPSSELSKLVYVRSCFLLGKDVYFEFGRSVQIQPREKFLFLDRIRVDEAIDEEVLDNGAVYLKTPVGKGVDRSLLEILFYDLIDSFEAYTQIFEPDTIAIVPVCASESNIRTLNRSICRYLHFYEPGKSLLDEILDSITKQECEALAFRYLALLMIKFKVFADSSFCSFEPRCDEFYIRSRPQQPEGSICIRDKLRVMINSVHNLPSRLLQNFSSFSVEVQIYFGTHLLEKKRGSPFKFVDTNGIFPHIMFESFIDFNLTMNRCPQEIKYVFLLIGMPIGQSTSSSSCCLGYATIPLFKHDSTMREGQWFVELSDIRDNQMRPWGPYSFVCSPSAPVLAVTFPYYERPVVFPTVQRSTFEARDFSSLPTNEQHVLLDLVENCDVRLLMEYQKDYGLSDDGMSHRETLWAKRMYLTHLPEALPLVLACVPEWSYGFLHHVHDMVDAWTELNYIQALQLLLPQFPNKYVREKACQWIREASSDSLYKVIPVLVEALRYETYDNNVISYLLVELGSTDLRFREEIMWQLKCRVDHGGSYLFCNRCEVLLNKLSLSSAFIHQCEIVDFLFYVQKRVSECYQDQTREIVLQTEMERLNTALQNEKGTTVTLPLDPSFRCEGVDVKQCKVLPSFNKPLKICFKGRDSTFEVLHKMGDDIRQDAIVMQLMQIMNDIWFEGGLDLRIITYKCIPVGIRRGLIEIVQNCETLHSIQSGCKGVFKDDSVLSWIQKNNPSEYDYEIAMDNFTRSCAGWCVATYILGIGDRHNENIMVTKAGHVFHIDFGKYMGDWQTAAGFRRDRVPFVFTTEMCFVINGGPAQGERFQNFIDYCCKAFNLLRGRYMDLLTILKLMACSDIPGINLQSLSFVENNLLLDISSTDATIQFTKMINESLTSAFPKLNFFVHSLAQAMSRGSSKKDPNVLSFVSDVYTKNTDGKIRKVAVIDCEKRYIPNKVYLYKCLVTRENESISSNVYRTFPEFQEFYTKLRLSFPMVKFQLLNSGARVRSNTKEVAVQRKIAIQRFLQHLFSQDDEIRHCHLVYTFFHNLHRDNCQSSFNEAAGPELSRNECQIHLTIKYHSSNQKLTVFVGHAKYLSPLGNGVLPDPYVKTYIRPGLTGVSTKRKTAIVKSTLNPTFNEELTYDLTMDDKDLERKQLEVSVWNSSGLFDNHRMYILLIPLKRIMLTKKDRHGVHEVSCWFSCPSST